MSKISNIHQRLRVSPSQISVEMVFRGLYHFSRAVLRGKATDVVTYFAHNYQMLGLIKQVRKRHRVQAAYYQEIWGSTA